MTETIFYYLFKWFPRMREASSEAWTRVYDEEMLKRCPDFNWDLYNGKEPAFKMKGGDETFPSMNDG